MPKNTVVLVTGTIEAGESLSAAIDCSGGDPVAVVMPEHWQPKTELSFQLSADGTTFHDVFGRGGDEVRIEITPGGCLALDRNLLAAATALKFRSGATSQAVAQNDVREFTIVLRLPNT